MTKSSRPGQGRHAPNRPRRVAATAAVALLTTLAVVISAGCQTPAGPPLTSVPRVDLTRFMGDWYVIASIPTWLEKNTYGAVENYRQAADGTIDIDFRYRKDSFENEEKHLHSRGFVTDASGGIWGVQFVWPIKADYRIAYLDPAYERTIIARENRDYVWIMARTPRIDEAEYQRLLARVAALGYDTSKVVKTPQR